MITNIQCRMARAALGLGVRDLAKVTDLSPNTIARLERGEVLHARTLAYIKGAFEAEGIIFVDDQSVSAFGGAGVRIGGNAPQSSMGRLLDGWWSMPDFRREPERAYSELLNLLEQYLNIVRSEEGRQPDAWERLDLNDMLNALNRSDIFSAAAYLRHAITPPDNQSPDYPLSNAAVESAAGLDLEYFDRCIAGLRQRGFQADRGVG